VGDGRDDEHDDKRHDNGLRKLDDLVDQIEPLTFVLREQAVRLNVIERGPTSQPTRQPTIMRSPTQATPRSSYPRLSWLTPIARGRRPYA